MKERPALTRSDYLPVPNHSSKLSSTNTLAYFGAASVAKKNKFDNVDDRNPADGSVTVVVDQLPTEIGSLTALQVSF